MVVSSKFGSLVDFVSSPTPADNASLDSYISTDNMLPDFGGIATATQLPKSGNVRQFQAGDTLFSNIRTYFRKVWGASFSGTCSPDVLLFRSKDSHVLNAKFLEYICKWDVFTEHTVKTSRGAKMPRGDKAAIADFEFPLPDIQYQENVADLLGSLDDKIELNRRMNAVLEGMARAVFVDWFVDFGPTRRKMAGEADPVKILGGAIRPPAQAQKTAALFPARLGENGLPEGWERVPVGEVSDIVGGGTPKTKTEEFWRDGHHHWATPRDLSKLSGVFIRNTERKLTDAGLAKVSSGLAPIGSVLMSSRAPIGYLAIAGVPIAVNQGFIVMRPTKRFPTHFAKLWCEENMETIEANANGSTFQEISKKNFKPILVTSPSMEVLGAFSEIVGALYKLILNNEVENQTLAAMRDLLLPKLMSGEIRLREGG